MRYMLMICDDESVQPSPAEMAADPNVWSWVEEMDRRGVLRGGERLQPSSDATTVRVRNDEVLLSDGPFAESKEQMGGYNLIFTKIEVDGEEAALSSLVADSEVKVQSKAAKDAQQFDARKITVETEEETSSE